MVPGHAEGRAWQCKTLQGCGRSGKSFLVSLGAYFSWLERLPVTQEISCVHMGDSALFDSVAFRGTYQATSSESCFSAKWAQELELLITSLLKVTDLHGRIRSSGLAGSRVELGTERESFLQVLDENPNFAGQPTAGRPYGKDWHCPLKGRQKTNNGTFSEFCGKEPCWRLGNTQMFKNTHPHLFNVAGSKDSCGDDTLRVSSGAKAPWPYGATLDKHDRPKAIEFLRRFRCAEACEVLRSGDENGRRLREPSSDQSGIWKIS